MSRCTRCKPESFFKHRLRQNSIKQFLILWTNAFALCCSALGASFSDQLQALRNTDAPAKVQEFIKSSYDANKNDPQYFVASANYWWGLAQEVNISTKQPEGSDFVIADQKTGKAVGSLSRVGQSNPRLEANAVDLLRDGFKRFPDRLDIGVGLAYMLRDQRQYKDRMDTLKTVLATAASHPADIRWKDGNPPPSPWKQFLPESLQDYTATLYRLETKEGDQWCQELCEAIVKVYPDHPYAYNILAGVSSAHKDEQGCIRYLQIALEKAPDDTLVMFNLGDAYRRTGDKASAQRYYEMVLAHDAPVDVKEDAKKAIASLQ